MLARKEPCKHGTGYKANNRDANNVYELFGKEKFITHFTIFS